MKTLKRFSLRVFLLFMPLLLASGSGSLSASVITQLGFAIDGSGSVNGTEFDIQRSGLANAFSALPTDGSVELTLVQFSSSARVEIAPTVITAANLPTIQTQVNAIAQIRGGTAPGTAIDLLTAEMTGSGNFADGAVDSVINLSTDGGFSLSRALTSTNAAQAAGIDAMTAEAIGAGANVNNLLAMVFNPNSTPGDGTSVLLGEDASPTNPFVDPAWVVPVSDFEAFGPVVSAKIQAIVPGPGPISVPEPGALSLLALALAGLSLTSWRRRQSTALCV